MSKIRLVPDDNGGKKRDGDIIQAAINREYLRISVMLQDGVNVNTTDEVYGYTILHIGCINGDRELIDIVLDYHLKNKSVDFQIRTKHDNMQAWQYAMVYHHYEIARSVDPALVGKSPNLHLKPS